MDTKRVYKNMETGEIYPTIPAAAKAMRVSRKDMQDHIDMKIRRIRQCRIWPYDLPVKKRIIEKPSLRKRIKNVYTERVYKSITHAARFHSVPTQRMWRHLNNRKPREIDGYTFIYYIPDESHKARPLRCTQTGEIFPSFAEVRRTLHVSFEAIQEHIDGKRADIKGFTFDNKNDLFGDL